MTIYLSNSNLQPTGWEPAEFIDALTTVDAEDRAPIASRDDATAQLDRRTHLAISRRVDDYLARLVDEHHGSRGDIRVVRELVAAARDGSGTGTAE